MIEIPVRLLRESLTKLEEIVSSWGFRYAAERVRAARTLVSRRMVIEPREDAIVLRIASSQGPARIVAEKRLTGGVATRVAGENYTVVASRTRLKCTCPDATYASPRLEQALTELGVRADSPETLRAVSTNVLCKHAALAAAAARVAGIVSYSDPVFRNVLYVAAAAAELRSGGRLTREQEEMLKRAASELVSLYTPRPRRGRRRAYQRH